MECTEPGLLSREELFAIAVGEPDERAGNHVQSCAACAATVAAYSREERALRGSLFRVACPEAQILGELALGLMGPEAALPVRRHLVDCRHCSSELRLLTSSLNCDPRTEMLEGPGLVRRIVARLRQAPAGSMLMAGVRGTPAEGPQVYEAEEMTISLNARAEGRGAKRTWSLFGLLDVAGMPPDASTTLRLLMPSGPATSLPLDEIGNFTAAGLQAGIYGLEIVFTDRTITIEDINIGLAGKQ
jgi:hypothetical protein